MKKVLLSFFIVLMAAVAGWSAEDPLYFCFEQRTQNDTIYITQEKQSDLWQRYDDTYYLNSSANPCFEKWSVSTEDAEPEEPIDAITYINQHLEDDYGYHTFLIASDIDLGGVNADSLSCKEAFAPVVLENRYSEFGALINPATGKSYKIKNFCYIADGSQVSTAGFVSSVDVNSEVKNLYFENPYVRVKNSTLDNPTSAAIAVGRLKNGSVHGITVVNGMVVAPVAGGFVGLHYGNYVSDLEANGLKVYIENSAISGTAAVQTSPLLAGGVVAVMDRGEDYNSPYIRNVALSGLDIQNKTSYPADVGGIVAKTTIGRSNSFIQRTYTVGSISSKNSSDAVGYIVGDLTLDENAEYHSISGNYHYGKTSSAPFVAGLLNGVSATAGQVDPARPETAVAYCIRNAVGDLPSDGNLFDNGTIAGDGEYIEEGYVSDAPDVGCVPGDQMKTALFAYALNSEMATALSIYDDREWTSISTENDGLPIFVSGDLVPSTKLVFGMDMMDLTIIPETLMNQKVEPMASYKFDGNYGIWRYADGAGKMASATLDSLLDFGGFKWVAAYTNEPLTSSSVFFSSQSFSLQKSHKIYIKPVYIYYNDAMGSRDTVSFADMQESNADLSITYSVPSVESTEIFVTSYDYFSFPGTTVPMSAYMKGGDADGELWLLSTYMKRLPEGTGTVSQYAMEEYAEVLHNLNSLTESLVSDMHDLYSFGAMYESLQEFVEDTLYLVYGNQFEFNSTHPDYGPALYFKNYVYDGESFTVKTTGFDAKNSSKVQYGESVEAIVQDYYSVKTTLAHSYSISYTVSEGYHVDTVDVEIDVAIGKQSDGQSSDSKSATADAGSVADGSWFGTVSPVANFLNHNPAWMMKYRWGFSMAADNSLNMDSMYVALSSLNSKKDSIMVYLTPRYEKDEFKVHFVRLLDEDVFYVNQDYWFDERTYSIDNLYSGLDYEKDFYSNFYKVTADGEVKCFTSWGLNEDGVTGESYRTISMDVMSNLTRIKEGSEINHLYPYIGNECAHAVEAVELNLEPSEHGSFALYQVLSTRYPAGDVYENDTVVHHFKDNRMYVPMEPDQGAFQQAVFYLQAEPEEGYIFDKALIIWEQEEGVPDTSEYTLEHTFLPGSRTYNNKYRIVPIFRKNVTYQVVFDLKGEGIPTFYGPEWVSGMSFTTAEGYVDLPTSGVYRANSCFYGWSISPDFKFEWEYGKDDPEGFEGQEPGGQDEWINRELMSYLTYEMVERYGQNDTIVMHAAWAAYTGDERCDQRNYKVTFASEDLATLSLTQKVGSVTHKTEVAQEGLLIPALEEPLVFGVKMSLNKYYTYDGFLTAVDPDGNETKIDAKKTFKVTSDMDFSANITRIIRNDAVFHVAYNMNSEGSPVFYDPAWNPVKKLMVKDGFVDLPESGAYRADACLVGWSLVPDFKLEPDEPEEPSLEIPEESSGMDRELLSVLNYEFIEDFGEDDAIQLYAVWMKNTGDERCNPKSYMVTFANDTAATVSLVQHVSDTTYATPVTKNGVLVPTLGATGAFAFEVDVALKEGYFYDGLLTVEKKGAEEFKIKSKDTLKVDAEISLSGNFRRIPNKKPAFTDQTYFAQSGTAAQFHYVLNDYDKDIELKIHLVMNGPVSVDTMLLVDATREASWSMYPLPPGTYYLTARTNVISFADSSAIVKDTIVIAAEVASVAKDSWDMLSMNAVDRDSVDFDDDDIRIYWWNESKPYGDFWQYQRLYKDDSVYATRGYWYSSLSGGSIPMKKNPATEPKDKKFVWALDSVYSGWNLVANPYSWDVSLNVDLEEDGDVKFWSWNSKTGEYERTDVVKANQAIWAEVHKKMDWTVSTVPVFPQKEAESEDDSPLKDTKSLQKSQALAKASSPMNWTIQAILTDGKGKRDSWNIFGAGTTVSSWEEPPSGMGDHVNLSILDGKKALAKSVKAAESSLDVAYEWDVELSASTARRGYLEFTGLENIEAYGYKVFVTVDGSTHEMKEGESIAVNLDPEGKMATVRVARNPKTVIGYAINGLRAVQAGRSLNVAFSAENGLAGAGFVAEVLNMKGEVMASTKGKVAEGMNRFVLEAPKAGLYMLRVRAGSQMSAGKINVK